MSKSMLISATIATLASQTAFAQDIGSECTRITSDIERLACYDRQFSSTEEASPLLAACEAALKAKLKSPSTYQRANVSEMTKKLSFDEYKDTELLRIRDSYDADTAVVMRAKLNEKIVEMKRDGEQASLFVQTIEYDAQNAFGAMIRGMAICSYVSGNGKQDGATAMNVDVGIM